MAAVTKTPRPMTPNELREIKREAKRGWTTRGFTLRLVAEVERCWEEIEALLAENKKLGETAL